jgi:AraC-like DNA-binding protein
MIYRNHRIPVATLRNLIADLARKGHPSIDRAAAHLGLSARSLQRQLEHQGITYSDLVEGTRQEIARGLLHDTTLSIAQVAAMLGYRDPSSFSRAFARWAGCSPRRYRAARRDGYQASG